VKFEGCTTHGMRHRLDAGSGAQTTTNSVGGRFGAS
jgi:hypothetical protein